MFVRLEVLVVTILGHKSLDVTITVDFNQVNIGQEGPEERQNNPINHERVRSGVPLGLHEVKIAGKSAQEGEEGTTGKEEDCHGVPTGVGREGLAMVRHGIELVRQACQIQKSVQFK